MNRQTRVVLYLARCLLVTLSGCASLPTNPFQTADKSAQPYESTLSLARLSERHGEPSTAVQLYHAVLAKDPQHQLAHHRLAVLATKQQRFDQAQHHFEQALAGTPDAQLLSDWGYYLYLTDRLPEADASLRQSLQLDQGNIAAHNNLGLVLGAMGRLDECLVEFRSAGDEASARANLAYVHSLNGEFEESAAGYHQALELNNQLKPAAEALLALHARKDANTAIALSQNPTIPAQRLESLPPVHVDGPQMAHRLSESSSSNPNAARAERSPRQVATVSYIDQGRGRNLVSRATSTVETARPLMNLPPVGTATRNAEPSTIETPANQQPASAPMALQSFQSQPWQAPTWTAN